MSPEVKGEAPQIEAYKREEARRSDAIAQRVYTRYRRRFATKHLFQRQHRLILSALCEDKRHREGRFRLLDVGCGFGSLLQEAYQQGMEAHGVELAPWNARTARADLPDPICVYLGDAERLPFQAATYDGVVFKGVLHHLGNPKKALKEAYRVLKPEGMICIFEGDPTSLYRRFVLGIADLLKIQHETTLFRHLAPQEIVSLLEEVGFTDIRIKPISGLFVPVGLQGWGGSRLWHFFDVVETGLQRRLPSYFRWHNSFLGRKPRES